MCALKSDSKQSLVGHSGGWGQAVGPVAPWILLASRLYCPLRQRLRTQGSEIQLEITGQSLEIILTEVNQTEKDDIIWNCLYLEAIKIILSEVSKRKINII